MVFDIPSQNHATRTIVNHTWSAFELLKFALFIDYKIVRFIGSTASMETSANNKYFRQMTLNQWAVRDKIWINFLEHTQNTNAETNSITPCFYLDHQSPLGTVAVVTRSCTWVTCAVYINVRLSGLHCPSRNSWHLLKSADVIIWHFPERMKTIPVLF